MRFDLSPEEVRVLCTLMEKAETTPDQYPMTTGALTTACNQKTSREPITDYSEQDVDTTILSLRERQAARSLRPSGARGWKHRHCLDEILPMTMAEQAIITVLGLRGPQSPGELRTRTSRIHDFEDNEDVEHTLAALASRPQPVVRNIGRETGQSQDRWEHLLGDEAMSAEQGIQRVMASEFATLHESGFFAMPNPWDERSAVTMQELGAKALATSSAALAATLGKDDYGISRDDLLRHVEQLTSVISIPLSVDGEQLFATEPGGITRTVELLASAGAAGASIEDFDPKAEAIIDIEHAVEAVEEAVEASRIHHLVLTARCESYLYGHTDIDEIAGRLQRYGQAGADCVYAPGVIDEVEILHLVESVGVPLNVLVTEGAPDPQTLAALGVRRSSTGSTVFNKAQATMVQLTRAFLGSESPEDRT